MSNTSSKFKFTVWTTCWINVHCENLWYLPEISPGNSRNLLDFRHPDMFINITPSTLYWYMWHVILWFTGIYDSMIYVITLRSLSKSLTVIFVKRYYLLLLFVCICVYRRKFFCASVEDKIVWMWTIMLNTQLIMVDVIHYVYEKNVVFCVWCPSEWFCHLAVWLLWI